MKTTRCEKETNHGRNEGDAPPPSGGTPPHRLTRRKTVAEVLTSDEKARILHRQTTNSSYGMAVAGEHMIELEYEEWDGSTPFYQHCIAGSLAGVAEHLLMFPFDTIKTHIQTSLVARPSSSAATTAAAESASAASAVTGGGGGANTGGGTMMSILRNHLHSTEAFGRLWRGAQAMAIGCIPAHAMYFSSYEIIKSFFLTNRIEKTSSNNTSNNLGPLGSTAAGSAAALSHDLIMVPADTVKQRLQLGYYNGMSDAFKSMLRQEGAVGLYRALPVTLCTNLPYGAVMVAVNESLREWLMQRQQNSKTLTVQTTLLAGCGAGMAAAAVTAPLDRLKTKLQTQGLRVVEASSAASAGGGSRSPPIAAPKYNGLRDAFRAVVRIEGYEGLFRGIVPRIVTHAPSVAISWTVYEVLKIWLATTDE